jgi:hypothetical protein
MHSNPKLGALQRQESHAERLFGKDASLPVPPPVAVETRAGAEAAASSSAKPDGDVILRKSYLILRGRIEVLPNVKLINRRGEKRVFPWNHFAGAALDHPGELVLIFDGPEGVSRITIGGHGLDPELLGGIEELHVEWIRELTELEAAAARRAGEPAVTFIGIEGGGIGWSRDAGESR